MHEKNKRYMIEAHVLPYFENKRMNEINPSGIIQWQNAIRAKGYSQTYLRMMQNQITALFTHASNIYNLNNNPCKNIKKKKEIEVYVNRCYGLPDNERLFPIVAEAVQHKLKRECVKSGVKQIRVHYLRHDHVAYLIN